MIPARPPRPARAEAGWSYLELVLCLSILVVLFAAVFSVGSSDLHYVAATREEGRAERVAAARLEVLRAGRALPAAGTRTLPPEPAVAGLLPGLAIVEEATLREPGLWAVEVRVTWTGAGGEARACRLATLVAVPAGEGPR